MDTTAKAVRGPLIVERILRGAYHAFMANGFAGTTTDMVQLECGVSKATIYRHFPSKEALYNAAMEHGLSQAMGWLEKYDGSDLSISDFLNRFGVEFLEQLLNPGGIGIFRIMVAEAQRFPNWGRMFYRVGPKPVTDVVETRLSLAHQQGALFVPNPAVSAEHYIGMVRGDIHVRVLLGEKVPSIAQLTRYVSISVDAFLDAYRARG